MSHFYPNTIRYIVMALAAWSLDSQAHAVVRTWNSSNSGIFTEIGNWAPNDAYPGPSDTAEFNSGSVAYTVTFPGSFINPPPTYVIDKLVVRTNHVLFSSQSFISPNLNVANPEDSIAIGKDAGEVAILTTTLRNLSGANTIIGLGSLAGGATGTLNVSSGIFSMSGEIKLGGRSGSSGTLNVRSGGRVNANVLNVGLDGSRGALLIESGGSAVSEDAFLARPGILSDTVTVTGAGSTWTNNRMLGLGDDGRITVQDGGALVTRDAYLGSGYSTNAPLAKITGVGSTWTNSGDIRIGGVDATFGTRYGALQVLDGALVSVGGQLLVEAGATPTDYNTYLGGNGTVAANVVNSSYVQPGIRRAPSPYSPAVFRIEGSYVQSATGILGIGIVGTMPGTQHDQLNVNGHVDLDGTLFVGLSNPSQFQPSAGDVFDILDWTSLSGNFSTLQLPSLAGGLSWDTSQLYTTGSLRVVGLLGDYNQNGAVDAADYVLWRKNPGSGTSLPNDDTPGVGPDDYTRWRANFGQPSGSGSVAGANATVPEPTSALLPLMGVLTMCSRRGANAS